MNKKFLLAIPAVALIIACGGNTEGSEDDVKRLNDQANGNASVATQSPKVVNIIEGDWEVGTKDNLSANIISPGTYVITSPEDSIMGCFWTTVKDFSGDTSAIIDGGLVEAGTSGRTVIKKTTGGLHLQGDCLAKKKVK